MLQVRKSFYFGGRVYKAGQFVDEKDPVAKSHRHLLTELTVERATAAPGEKRATPAGKPKKKGKAKPAKKSGETKGIITDDVKPAAGGLVCEDCGNTFKNQGGLASHRRAKHDT